MSKIDYDNSKTKCYTHFCGTDWVPVQILSERFDAASMAVFYYCIYETSYDGLYLIVWFSEPMQQMGIGVPQDNLPHSLILPG